MSEESKDKDSESIFDDEEFFREYCDWCSSYQEEYEKEKGAEMKIGGRYNWQNQPERLVYIGRNWSGNGYWHQFEKVDELGIVWCELLDSDLHLLEQSEITEENK